MAIIVPANASNSTRSNMNTLKSLCTASCCFLLIVTGQVALAATHNVSTTAELRQALLDAAGNGQDDTIVIADGTYATTDDGGGTFHYLSPQNDMLEIKGSTNTVIISTAESSAIRIDKPQLAKPTMIENLNIKDSYRGIEITGSLVGKNLTITNNIDTGIKGMSDNTRIELIDCLVSNNGSSGVTTAISYPGATNSPIILEHTEVINNGGIGVYTFTMSGKSGVTAHNSKINNNAGGGIYASYDSDLEIINVEISGNGGDGIKIGYRTDLHLEKSTICGNTGNGISGNMNNPYVIIDSIICDNTIGLFTNENLYPVYLYNSIISQNNIGIQRDPMNSPQLDQIYLYNSYVSGNATHDVVGNDKNIVTLTGSNNYLSISNTVMVTSFLSNTISSGDPGFVDSAAFNYALTPDSILIDAGTTNIPNFTLLETDKDGNQRISGGSVDIGPYEYSLTRPTISSFVSAGTTTLGVELTFTINATPFSTRTIAKYEIDFGDGIFHVVSSPVTHTYSIPGNFTVTAKVTDNEGEYSTSMLNLTIVDLTIDEKIAKSYEDGKQYVQDNPTEFRLVTEDDRDQAVVNAEAAKDIIITGLNTIISESHSGFFVIPIKVPCPK